MKLTLRDLLNIVFRFKRALLIFWGVALIAIAVYYTQSARKYSSKARILVSLGTENEGRADYLNNKNLQLMQREQQIHNEQQILLSEHVLLTTAKWILGEPTPGDPPPPMDEQVQEARRYLTGEAPEATPLLRLIKSTGKGVEAVTSALSFGKKGAPIPESTKIATLLAQNLDAKTIFNSDALDVTFHYRDPRIAQTILKLILAAYMDHHIAVFQSAGESDLLKAELDRSVGQYQARLNEMANFMTTHRLFTEDTQVNSFIEQRQQVSQALTDAAADRQASTARIFIYTGLNNTLKRYETYSTVDAHNQLHDDLVSKLNEAQVREREILNSHPEGSQIHEDQTAILQRIRELLANEPARVTDQREERRSGASELAEQQLMTATASEKAAEARIAQLQHELGRVNESLDGYAKNLPGYDIIKLNLDFSKQQSEQMGKAYVSSRLRILTAQNEITDISVIDQPSWEPEASSPKKSMTAALAFALLILGGVAVVLVGAGLDQTMNDRHSVEADLAVPVTAVLPMISREEGDVPRLLELQTETEFARIYTLIRHAPKPGVVVLLTGSKGGEGLSLVGYELARFLGRNAGSRTALLDCTSNPVEHTSDKTGPVFLSLPPAQHSLDAINESERGSSPVDLLNAWREEFSYIVIASSAAKDMYRLVDILPSVSAAFVVLEAGRTRRATASSTLDLLRSYGVQNIQLILNKRVFFVPEWLVRRI